MIQLNLLYLTAVISTVIPLLVALVTKSLASRLVKTVTNLFLSAVAAGVATAITANGSVALESWLVGILVAFGTSLISHYNLWKPTGITNQVLNLAPDIGIGAEHYPSTAELLDKIRAMPGVEVFNVQAEVTSGGGGGGVAGQGAVAGYTSAGGGGTHA